jgi:hypothetical protein
VDRQRGGGQAVSGSISNGISAECERVTPREMGVCFASAVAVTVINMAG